MFYVVEEGTDEVIRSGGVFVRGYFFIRGDKLGFVDNRRKVFSLSGGEVEIDMPEEECNKFETALKAFEVWAFSKDDISSGASSEELFTGKDAIFINWHRGIEISL